MKRRNKGFTLIELLAVIVILGLLMAIAIPSVTKYITQSRKKTVSTTIDNYMSALTNQVNDMEYTFTAANTIYAVPIECIAVERGGTNPFGEWHQASNSYWAYVLVQYDDNTSSYIYGFTFKDSAGYGLYPTSSEKLNESGSQIQTGLSLTRPTDGNITNITAKANWLGFDVKDDTNLEVLVASSEGETGNGTTTCTLCQKGKNYTQVEEEKTTLAQGITGNVNWKLSKNGVLTVSGNGAMGSTNLCSTQSTDINTVVIEEGVTSIGNNAFRGCSSLITVTIPSSVTSIGNYAFQGCASLDTVKYNGTSQPTCSSNAFYGVYSVVTVPTSYNGDTFCGTSVLKK